MVTRYNTQVMERKISEYREHAQACYARCTESSYTAFWEGMAANWEHMADSLETVLSQQAYVDSVESRKLAA